MSFAKLQRCGTHYFHRWMCTEILAGDIKKGEMLLFRTVCSRCGRKGTQLG